MTPFQGRNAVRLVPVVLVLAVVAPFLLSSYQVYILTTALIFSIFAITYNLLQGYLGAVSFGHAAFLGIGGYATAIYIERLGPNLLGAWLSALGVSMIAGILIGVISFRSRGIYFAMLTLAFAQLLYVGATQLVTLTNGINGITNFLPTQLFLFSNYFDLINPTYFYFFVLVHLIITFLITRRIANSHFGLVLRAVRDNEARLTAIGFNIQKYKVAVFTITAIFAGLAGYLLALLQNVIGPQTLYYTTSGAVIFMALIGGANSLFGPLVGAFAWVYLTNTTSSLTTSWAIALGAIFIVIILFAPAGLIATLKRGRNKRSEY